MQVLNGTLRFSSVYAQTAGKTIVGTNSVVNFAMTFTNIGGGVFGTGYVVGNITNTGNFNPGKSPGILTLVGSFSQGPAGALDIELAGTTLGTSYDRFDVTGPAVLGGSLNVTLLDGFTPAAGDRYEVMRFASRTGTFPVKNGMNLGGGFVLMPSYSATNLVLVATNVTLLTPVLSTPLSVNPHGSLQFSWDSVVDQTYQVEVSSNLVDWFVLTNLDASATTTTFIDPTPPTPMRFYRLR